MGGTLVHVAPGRHCDDVVRLMAVFCVATMHFMHLSLQYAPECLAGILNDEKIQTLEQMNHPPLYITDEIWWLLKLAFCPLTSAAGSGQDVVDMMAALEQTQQHAILTQHVEGLVLEIAGMERI